MKRSKMTLKQKAAMFVLVVAMMFPLLACDDITDAGENRAEVLDQWGQQSDALLDTMNTAYDELH